MRAHGPLTGREKDDEEVQVKEEGRPGRGLVLRHGRDDGDVLAGIVGIPERVEAAAPRTDDAQRREEDEATEADDCDRTDERPQQVLELIKRADKNNVGG